MRYAEIIEARAYDSMYDGFVNLWKRHGIDPEGAYFLNDFTQEMKKARQYLKREDRIVWYMRIVKLQLVNAFYISMQMKYSSSMLFNKDAEMPPLYVAAKAVAADAFGQWEAEMGYPFPKGGPNNSYRFPLMGELSHYVSMEDQIPAIRAYRWERQSPSTLLNDLRAIEDEWRETEKTEGRYITNRDPVLIRFPDGAMWVHLQRPSCDIEGRAMGHCGNSAAAKNGDTILSLRKPSDRPGKVSPYLTFILHRDGTLGEMKGRFNEKPAREFHQYIMALLMNPIVKGIRGEGYAPENNFALRDLTPDERKELKAEKPSLFIHPSFQEY